MRTSAIYRHSGFTLIELLVVIAIIGLLASIILVSLNGARAKGRDARRLSDIHQLQVLLEAYRSTYGTYPPSGQGTNSNSPPNGAWSSSNDSGTSWSLLGTAVGATIPTDVNQHTAVNSGDWPPYNGSYSYSYYYCVPENGYMIVWRPEATTLPSPGVTCNGSFYNYGSGTVTQGRPY